MNKINVFCFGFGQTAKSFVKKLKIEKIPFKLTVWDNIDGSGNIIYQQEEYPVHTENGEYHTYFIKEPFKIVGTFYVGWEQVTDDLLNIGLDKNNKANNYMFYNVGGGWSTSIYEGSWMIRPILSMSEIISYIRNNKLEFKVFPNPVESELFVETSYQYSIISIYSLEGILVRRYTVNSNLHKIDVNSLSSGVYFVECLSNKHKEYHKIIVR